ncbi:MAG: cobalamin biosynthesis protein CbiD [Nitrospinae bacterium]|nr:cobalamin biosynthesis protein CbiD [Nitrospinota bacterium]
MTAELKNGYTTGSCAAGAAKAAVMLLLGSKVGDEVDIPLPNGGRISLPVLFSAMEKDSAKVGVKKYSGDDPDATDGVTVFAQCRWGVSGDVVFEAGEGVGTVTKKGLQIPPGEPAINPVPRKMVLSAVREATDRGVIVTISIPGGEAIAKNTFNPRLGVVGGLSILGTTGIVRPYSHSAVKDSLKCALDVAMANGGSRLVLTAGNIGTKSAKALFGLPSERVVEAGNEWGFMIDLVAGRDLDGLLIVGHPGKLAKLPAGQWDTHSSRSGSSASLVAELAKKITGEDFSDVTTADGVFSSLVPDERRRVGDVLAKSVAEAVAGRIGTGVQADVALVNMQGELLGSCGELELWRA